MPLLSSQRANTELASAVKPPHQFEAFGRVRLGDLMNRTALRFEIIDQASSILPVNEGSGPRDSAQSLSNLLGNLRRTFRAGQLKRMRRFTLAWPLLTSISNSAKRSGPSASRFFFIQGFSEATGFIRSIS